MNNFNISLNLQHLELDYLSSFSNYFQGECTYNRETSESARGDENEEINQDYDQ